MFTPEMARRLLVVLLVQEYGREMEDADAAVSVFVGEYGYILNVTEMGAKALMLEIPSHELTMPLYSVADDILKPWLKLQLTDDKLSPASGA